MLDVRDTACSIKHGLILQTFFDLKCGGDFILCNGADPVPLRSQFDAAFPGALSWEHRHRRPKPWRVENKKSSNLTAVPCVGARSGCFHGINQD